ncbi:uncharacterized protein LOC143540934 [Bidens hawaiensis]|uniref:uncharacterized protein LOC143540934 n=1 Tax=Bidens hawaiensis TaxID=980011 RepID=UPI00404B0B22
MKFWEDIWAGNSRVKEVCPNLFKLERNKLCNVSDMFWRIGGEFGWKWDWIRYPNSAQEMAKWEKCFQIMTLAVWKGGQDAWEWLGDSRGDFTVRSVKKMILKEKEDVNNYVMKWSKWVPAKCNIHVWRVEMNRIPTRMALVRRNVPVTNDLCVFCELGNESADHIITGCMVAAIVWDHARNEKVFEGKDIKIEDIIGDIKSLGFLWFKYRSKNRFLDWSSWCKFKLM